MECRVDTQEQHNGGSNDAWGSDESVGSAGPPSVETVVSNDSSTQNSDESGLEIDDDSDSGKSWEWDLVWDFGVNPDEYEEVIGALKEASQSKFEHGKRHGCNRKQRNLERRWRICMKTVGRKRIDSVSRAMINGSEEAVNDCIKEMGEWGNYVEMLELADNWMGKRNRLARLVVDWKLVQDGHWKWKKKNGVTESSEMSKEQTEDGCENEKSEGQGGVVSFMLKDPVVFECVTRCMMTGETREDSALVHETSVVMKV